MHKFSEKWYCSALGRDMHVNVYGSGGAPVLMVPTQNGMANQYEDFGIVKLLSDYIDGGRIQLFCIDTVDVDSWSAKDADGAKRTGIQEAYYKYVTGEMVPFIHRTNASAWRPFVSGCSLGATHSAIFALRRPDLFQGCLALSGVYDAQDFWGAYMDETLYLNSPVHFMGGMDANHPYVKLLNERKLIFCTGTGAWEEEGIRTLGILRDEFQSVGIKAWCDFWGPDVNHDWNWWEKQYRYFLPFLLGDR